MLKTVSGEQHMCVNLVLYRSTEDSRTVGPTLSNVSTTWLCSLAVAAMRGVCTGKQTVGQ